MNNKNIIIVLTALTVLLCLTSITATELTTDTSNTSIETTTHEETNINTIQEDNTIQKTETTVNSKAINKNMKESTKQAEETYGGNQTDTFDKIKNIIEDDETPTNIIINLAQDTTYNFTSPIGVGMKHEQNITINGNNAVLKKGAPGAFILFNIENKSVIKLDNLTIRDTDTLTAAIFNNGNLTITNSIIENNTIEHGTPIQNYGSLNISNTTLQNNTAEIGGAIENNGNLIITDSILQNNNATEGGAINNKGILGVTGTRFSYNNATYSGVISNKGTLTITDSEFSYNNATYGGALQTVDQSTMTITRSRFNYNTAEMGGAITTFSSTITNINDTNFTYNSASDNGGALYTNLGEVYLTKCIFNNNIAPNNNIIRSSGGIINIKNSIIANSTSSYIIDSSSGTITIKDTSLIGNNATRNLINSYGKSKINLENNNITNNIAETIMYNYNNEAEIVLTGNSYFNNTPVNWDIVKLEGKNRIMIIDDEGVIPSNGTIKIYLNNILEGIYTVKDKIVENYDAKLDYVSLKLIYTGENEEKYKENEYILEDGTLINVTMTANNATANPDENATIIVRFNETVISGEINISDNGNNTIKEVKISLPTDYLLFDINTSTLQYGENKLDIIYTGSKYSINNTTSIITIKAPTRSIVNVNNQTTMNTNITIKVDTLNETKKPTGIITVINIENKVIGIGYLDENSKSNIKLDVNTTGPQNVTIKYAGDNYYQENNKTITLNITRQAIINTTILNNTQGNVTIKTNITRDDNTPIREETVEIILPNGTKTTSKTDTNGIIIIQDRTTSEGNTSIRIKIGDTTEIKGTESITPINIIPDYQEIIDELNDTINNLEETLDKLNKTSVITAVPDNGTVDNAKVVVTLNNKQGTPITNAPITIKNSKGETIGNNTTDKNGVSIIPISTKAGQENITVTYPGDSKFTPTSTTVSVTTSKNNVTVTVDPVNGVIGENIVLTAHIKDTKGNSATGGNLVFKLNGKTLRTDGSFNSTAPVWKFTVKNGIVTVTIKADIYLRNAKNLSASYSGTYKYEEAKSEVVTAEIKKRNAQITVTSNPKSQKQYQTIKFTAKLTDTTPNKKNTTAINTNTQVLFKINSKTLKDSKNKQVLVKVVNGTATYKYTVPQGMGGITKTGETRDYTVETVLVSDTYYPDTRATTTFNVQRSPVTINIAKVSVKNNKLSVKATIKDYKGNNVIGSNDVNLKINGKTYVNPKTKKTQNFKVTDGKIDLANLEVADNIKIKKVMIVTGARQAYLGARNETSNIVKA